MNKYIKTNNKIIIIKKNMPHKAMVMEQGTYKIIRIGEVKQV